jgi:hypothetical protein
MTWPVSARFNEIANVKDVTLSVAEDDLASLRSFLRPVWEPLGADWFVLWLPLRRKEYCNEDEFIGRYDGDQDNCPPELGMAAKSGNIARTLPLLHSIKMFEFWERWTPSETQPTAKVCLKTTEIRSQFRACVKANADECGAPAAGRYTISYEEEMATVLYSLAQSWTPDLLELSGDNHWPMSSVLDSGQKPDKSQPHGAVLLARRTDRKSGGLDVATAVFLPLEASDPKKSSESESEFFLTLHGCFFIDSGRRYALHDVEDVRGEWNRRLMQEGVLPLIIPAIETFAKANDDSEVLTRLTQKLERWISEEDRRKHVCGKYGWLRRWFPQGLRWERVENSSLVVEIPAFGTDAGLPLRAMPSLSDVSQELVLTPAGQPRLMLQNPRSWQDELVGRVLTIENPDSLYQEDGTALKYYHDFVQSLREIGDAGCDSLHATLHKVFARVGTKALRGPENACRNWTQALVKCLPSNSRLGLALGGNWPDDARRNVCSSVSRILIVPDEFEPSDSRGTGQLTIDEAVTILERLAPHMTANRNSNPALAILKATDADAEELLSQIEGLRLWKVDRITTKGKEPLVVSRTELTSGRAVFAGDQTPCVELLAGVLAAGEVWVVPTELAGFVLPPDAPTTDVGGVLAFLATCPPLADIGPHFVSLFEVLRSERKDPNWRVALRYLFHRCSDVPLNEELLIGDSRQGVWGNLASAALNARGTPDRVIPTSELTRALDPSLMSALGLALLDAEGVAPLLKKADPFRVEITFRSDERDKVLRGFQEDHDLIRGLPLHDRADGGGMTRITDNSYWEDTGKPGTLARHIQLLRKCEDEVLAAIQRKAHPAPLTPVEVVRLALRHDPADHWETLLTALRSSGTLPKELSAKLKERAWLPLAAGGKASPENVLHDPQFDDQIDAVLRAIKQRRHNDPVSCFELPDSVRNHDGFRELARQLFPDRKQLISRLASFIRGNSSYHIGGVDLRSREERSAWLGAFREAPAEVMAASSLIGRVNEVDSDLCETELLPPLCKDSLPPKRLEQILAFLRERHSQGRGSQLATLRIHNLYLRLATHDRSAFRSLLPQLKLLSETGEWADPSVLCVAEGLDPARTLDSEQKEILKGLVARETVSGISSDVPTDENSQSAQRVTTKELEESVGRLRDYFSKWRTSAEFAGWAGAFLSLLGDYEPLRKLAHEFLEMGCAGRTVEYIRAQTGMQEAKLILEREQQSKSPSELMKNLRVLVQVTDLTQPIQVRNLLGKMIEVKGRSDFSSLLVGFGMDRIEGAHPDGWRVHALHLRAIDPASLTPSKRRDIVALTGKSLLRVFCGQEESQIDFERVLDEFSGDDAFGVRVAQESFLNGASYSLGFLGLKNSSNGQLRDLLRLSEEASARRAEESAIEAMDTSRSLSGRSAQSMEKEVRDRLRELVSGDRGVQQELVAAVRRKVQEYRYEPRSVLFELFQNADDACAERGCLADFNAMFVCQVSPEELVVLHNGRPINHTVGDDDSKKSTHRHDLRKMLSLGHSDKGHGSSAGNVTGRFGLGFKSVFLLTDTPRIVSGRLAFDVIGGVYPLLIKPEDANALRDRIEKAGLSRENGTIFQMPARADVDLNYVVEPFQCVIHYLVVFARRIRSIRCQTHHVDWNEQTILSVDNTKVDNTKVVKGTLRPIDPNSKESRRAIVFRCGQRGDVLFGWDESGFRPIPESIPSIWVTAPTTEYHGVGYLVNAPLDLDVGRSQVTWNNANNTDRLKDLGRAVGDALIALFDARTGNLDITTDAYGLWRSLWEIISRSRDRRELHESLMWGESGAATRLYSQRAALPTGIAAGSHETLTSLSDIKYVLVGTLDAEREEKLLSQVVTWRGFASHYSPGSIVSQQRVWSRLSKWCSDKDPQPINLATIVGNEFRSEPYISPDRADSLGAVIDRELLGRIKARTSHQSSEYSELCKLLQSNTRFLTQARTWEPPKKLLVPPNVTDSERRDEALRSAFAPPERVLANEYVGTGVEFFLACRGEMSCPLDEMARWARTADTESRRSAVLTYLRKGQQGARLQEELHKIGIEGTWLAEIGYEDLRRAGFDDRKQTATLVMLGVLPSDLSRPFNPSPQPILHTSEANHLFSEIGDWWEEEGDDRIKEYNRLIYPEGRLPHLTSDGPSANPSARIEWLKFFIICIVQTLGRVKPEQNREFIRLCETQGWLEMLADSQNGPRNWLAAIELYIDRHSGHGIRYFHWLRHFVGVATVSRHLDAYADSFLSINRFEGRFEPRDALSIRTSRQFQFGGPDAPTLVPILGIGANFALRELVRMRLVDREDVHPFCYPAVARLRRFLERLGWQDDENGSPSERSRSIFEFISRYRPNDPTFGNAFDIPLLMYMEKDSDSFPSIPLSDDDFMSLEDD